MLQLKNFTMSILTMLVNPMVLYSDRLFKMSEVRSLAPIEVVMLPEALAL